MDLPKKKLRNMTGRNTTWGVFKAYAFFFNITHLTNIALPPQRAYKSNLQKNAYPLKTPHVVGPQFVYKVMLVHTRKGMANRLPMPIKVNKVLCYAIFLTVQLHQACFFPTAVPAILY